MLVLAIAQAALAGFTALVGAFADGGDIWSRLLLILVHPLCAAGLLLLVLLPRPATAIVLAIAALLVVNVGADLFAAGRGPPPAWASLQKIDKTWLMIARGAVRGDWLLPAIFSVIPAIGVVYALTLARMRPRPDDG